MKAAKQLTDLLGDWHTRLNSLYWIQDKDGNRLPFRMNRAQQHFWDNFNHPLNIILKARQLGFSTFIQIFLLDACLFNRDVRAGTIAHTKDDAADLFEKKIRFAYDNLPEEIKAARAGKEDSTKCLSFANGSSIQVGTSLRSGTYQYLHVSEFGKLCAKYPEKAREVVTGGLNTVHAGNIVFIESTAEGREGKFYEMCEDAQNSAREGRTLTSMDYKFHFYDWRWEDEYSLSDDVQLTAEDRDYFAKVERETGNPVSSSQRAWYVKKRQTQKDDMKREFPSTAEEAFEAAIEGAYFARQMAFLRENKRLQSVAWEPSHPVNTLWDLGKNDLNAIWFHQHVNGQHRLIDYYENSGEWLAHYAKVLKNKPYTYGRHFLPHDVEVQTIGEPKTRKETLIELGVRPVVTVRRALNLGDDIEATRNFLVKCWFDETNCSRGISRLDNYRKRWNETAGAFSDQPVKDDNPHGADALRTGAVGWKEETQMPAGWKKRNKSWIR